MYIYIYIYVYTYIYIRTCVYLYHAAKVNDVSRKSIEGRFDKMGVVMPAT